MLDYDEFHDEDTCYESLKVMMMRSQQDCAYYNKNDYFKAAIQEYKKRPFRQEAGDIMDESWRRKMCVWSYMVVDHFDLDREIVDISYSYIDRYFSLIFNEFPKNPQDFISIDRNSFQLVSATALYIAIKLHGESSHFKSHHLLEVFVQLSRGLFQPDDMIHMEKELLSALQWHLNPPTSATFVFYMIESGLLDEEMSSIHSRQSFKNPRKIVFEVAKFFTELAVGDFDLVISSTPQCIAVGSILNVLCLLIEPNLYATVLKTAIPKFKLTTIELETITQVQLALNELCPFSFSQSSSFLRSTFESFPEQPCLDFIRNRSRQNSSANQSNSFPISDIAYFSSICK